MNDQDCARCSALDVATLETELTQAKKDADAAKAQIVDLTTKLADAEKKVTESEAKAKDATTALDAYRDAESKALIETITARSDFKADEVKGKTVEELRTIRLAIDKAKPPVAGTVKSVRHAGDSAMAGRPNVMQDGRIDPRISIMGNPVRQDDGSYKWVTD